MTDLGDTLVQNNLAYAVFGPLTAEASFIYRWFREPAARSGYPAEVYAAESRALVADLRAAVTPRGDAPARSLVARLLGESPEFAALWEMHDVAVMRQRHKRIRHPEVGCSSSTAVPRRRGALTILALFSPLPGTAPAERLTLLAPAQDALGTQLDQSK
jgi:hypothetical protein